MKTYLVKIGWEIEKDGRINIFAPDLPGCNTWGRNINEAVKNIEDAVRVYLEDIIAANGSIPKKIKVLDKEPSIGISLWQDFPLSKSKSLSKH